MIYGDKRIIASSMLPHLKVESDRLQWLLTIVIATTIDFYQLSTLDDCCH